MLSRGQRKDFPAARDMAYTDQDGDLYVITVRPGFDREPEARQLAVLQHELGHVTLMHKGFQHHTEREADGVAELLFHPHRIYYDADDVQTVDPDQGVNRPRPVHLPA